MDGRLEVMDFSISQITRHQINQFVFVGFFFQVNPVLRKYAREALDLGLPIVRPLWMLDPQDPACRIVADEFSIGDEIIVAPVLKPGSVEREVYLPTGVWKDGIDGSLRKGSRWIHMYKVGKTNLAGLL